MELSRYRELLAVILSIAIADMLVAIPTTGYVLTRWLQNHTSPSDHRTEKKTVLQALTLTPPALALAAVLLVTISPKIQSLVTSIIRVFTIAMLIELKTDNTAIAIWISNVVWVCQIFMDLMASAIGKPTNDGPKSTAKKVSLRICNIALTVTLPLVIISVLMALNLERFRWQQYALYTVGWEILLAISYFWTMYEALKSANGPLDNKGTSRNENSYDKELYV